MKFKLVVALILFGVSGCATQPESVPDNQNRVIDIVNDTTTPILRVYGRAQTGSRQLYGDVTLAPRGYTTINFANNRNACNFVLLAEFEQIASKTVTLDVCTSSVWRIH